MATVEPGVFGRILHCPRTKDFCKVAVGAAEGWLKRDEFWGVYKSEWID